MMFEVMAFKFCPIHIKHQTFNFKLKKRCLHATALFLPPKQEIGGLMSSTYNIRKRSDNYV